MFVCSLTDSLIHGLDWDIPLDSFEPGSNLRSLLHHVLMNTDEEWNTIEDMHPMTFMSKISAEDTPRWHEAMNGPFKDEWWKACEIELETLKKLNVWDVIDREDWMNMVPGIWALESRGTLRTSSRSSRLAFAQEGTSRLKELISLKPLLQLFSGTQ